MYLFSVGYKRRLEKLDILKKTVLLKIYMDDLNQAGWCLPLGTFYKDGKMFVPKVGWRGRFYQGKKLSKNEMEAIEVEAIRINNSNYTRDEREAWSAGIYKQIANEVMPDSVKMKEDTPGKHQNGLLPILDTKVYVKDGKI